MSPAGTMARVYLALKAQVMAGHFAPGERIDPARLGPELSASVTPIRDALHRLAGERLVENWNQEGFRQPIVTESGLRDLYGWSADLLMLVLRATQGRLKGGDPLPGDPLDDWPSAAAKSFLWLAGQSPNLEHRIAVHSLNDRSHAVRAAEARVMTDPAEALADLFDAVAGSQWQTARRAVTRYHATRLRVLPEIASQFRPREG